MGTNMRQARALRIFPGPEPTHDDNDHRAEQRHKAAEPVR
jgi:hypothetical protein